MVLSTTVRKGFHLSMATVMAARKQQAACKFISSQTKDLPAISRLKDTEASIASKGFLRAQKAYDPPEDVTSRLNSIIESVFGNSLDFNAKLENPTQKFKFLEACSYEFSHSVPNSLLHTMETLGDVIKFYKSPVSTRTPLDQLKSMDLPPNLHVQYEYHRFHPDDDVMFGGITAFPKSSTLVTGLKYKKKYRDYMAKKSWP
ncbi:hypothetical protein J437_LFUL005481 [Ladona fulva]|uniref:Large ribosomal subunit protein mL50 n=1 Tax=Ladona fulva TaxID=123851 RepID=A0A8K0JWX8_LADFU|nr:hypothetical protein J437_LFUL005481 [Ladona fulva]